MTGRSDAGIVDDFERYVDAAVEYDAVREVKWRGISLEAARRRSRRLLVGLERPKHGESREQWFERCHASMVETVAATLSERQGINLAHARKLVRDHSTWISEIESEDERIVRVMLAWGQSRVDRKAWLRERGRRQVRAPVQPLRESNGRADVSYVVPRSRESESAGARASSAAGRDGPSSSDDDPPPRLGRLAGRLRAAAFVWFGSRR
jgi:hypothetical protein